MTDLLAEVCAAHVEWRDARFHPDGLACRLDGTRWPCDAIKLAALLTPERLADALRTIHGNIVPLPNRPTVEEYADIILQWWPAALTSEEPT